MTTRASWNIADGPGVTALGLAAARAVESDTPDRLTEDRYADAFVEPRQSNCRCALAEIGEYRFGPGGAAPARVAVYRRSHPLYDDYLLTAAGEEIQQAVVQGAGLDTRAYRLDLPSDFRIYEVDQPGVLEFKDSVLSQRSAEPRCVWGAIRVDLRRDWPAALHHSGFDSASRTAWIAEGLLAYLPADAEQRLLERLHRLSIRDSRLALDRITGSGVSSSLQ